MSTDSTSFSVGATNDPFVVPPVVAAATPLVPGRPKKKLQRVLHIINGEHYAGAERVQDLLAARLPEFGYQVDFACVKAGQFPTMRTYQKAQIFDVTMQSRFDFRAVTQLKQIVQANDYALVHAHTPRSLMVARLLTVGGKLPLVYHVHSPAARDSTRPWINRFNSVTERVSLWGAERMIAVSESLARHMMNEGYDPRLIRVVPNGVPASVSAHDRPCPKGTWTLGVIALFRPRKGVEVLLEAIRQLRDRGYAVRLRAVGTFETPEYQEYVLGLARETGVEDLVEWVGFQRDVNSQLKQMGLFVLPSLFGEGMPMVVLEAMAMGVPVIGTDVEGVPEVIRDGMDGRIARPGDAGHLAEVIASVLDGESDWDFLRQNALDRHAAQYSDRSMALATAAVYDELLESLALDPTTTPSKSVAREK